MPLGFFRTSIALSLAAGALDASPFCADFTDAAEELAPLYIDMADPVSERVTLPIEGELLQAQIAQTSPGPLQKIYCDIGMFEMRVRFVMPAEDDAIAAEVTEATYAWDATQDPAGWVLFGLRRQMACARGDAVFTDICP